MWCTVFTAAGLTLFQPWALADEAGQEQAYDEAGTCESANADVGSSDDGEENGDDAILVTSAC